MPAILSVLLVASHILGTFGTEYSSPCQQYADCMKLTFSPSMVNSCGLSNECGWSVCLVGDFKSVCRKCPPGSPYCKNDSISHVCYSKDCSGELLLKGAVNQGGFSDGEKQCIVAKAGETVYFAIKDASPQCEVGPQGVTFFSETYSDVATAPPTLGTTSATCKRLALNANGQTCSGNGQANIDATCVYAVKLPELIEDCKSPPSPSAQPSPYRPDCLNCAPKGPTCGFQDDILNSQGYQYVDFLGEATPDKLLASIPAEYGCQAVGDCGLIECAKNVPDKYYTDFGPSTCPN